jgi:hypothetical protein
MERQSSIKLDLVIGGMLALVGALARIPYLALIPVFKDEVMQTVYALSIQPGKFMPFIGNDPYVGPLFSYLIAVCLHIFGSSPVAPRIIALLMGALTVGLIYLLARVLGLRWPWAALVGLLMVANPHHILINSHYAGSTYLVPLFSTAFLLAIALAVKRESRFWLVAAGALFGLALQANPVSALVLPGVIIWFLVQRKSRIGLRTPWPYLAVVAFVAAYAPVIIYNVQNELFGALTAQNRQTYIWQPNPSLPHYIHNLWRLILQLGRQLGGVLGGDESLRDLVGLPLVFGLWGLAGLIYAARQRFGLLALAVSSHLLIMPWVSNYYGDAYIARFTNHLTPLIYVEMVTLTASGWAFVRARLRNPTLVRATIWVAGTLIVALCLWPLVSLFRFYDHAIAQGETNTLQLSISDEFMRQWHGERVLLSNSVNGWMSLNDSETEFNATEYLLATNRVPYTLMPLGRILERLATGQETGRIILILHEGDLPQTQSQADLIVWDSPAMQAAHKLGYGIYTIADARQVRKPTFVLTDGTPLATSVRAVQVNFADQLSVIGYEPKAKLAPGERFIANVYWKAIGAIPESYTGFLHLTGPDGRLVAQDDHELGRGFYRTLVWQADEVIRERYEWVMPKDVPNGDYTLQVGVYSFPSLKRLPVRSTNTSARDDLVWLDTIHVGP